MTDKTGQGMWNTSYLWLKQVRDMMDIAKQEGDKITIIWQSEQF